MDAYDQVFENNRKWVLSKKDGNPNFFEELAREQRPEFLYIGCSDSRVPANEIMGLEPGEVFVHRNIANVVNSIDLNCMSVINYAVVHLQVKYIIVCGHYDCGGVKAAMEPRDLGVLNPWLRNIRDVYRHHQQELDAIADNRMRYNRLVELNVIEQCVNVIKTAEVQQCYKANGFPKVAGWVFDLHGGELIDLNIDFTGQLKEIQKIYNLDVK
ncbi:carbonic anhydrase [Arcticibacter tournemirensis]|uniref:Carbonic anhydrase 2 n=1 Tax=Arcticibacter tournemirensis TaxID=699437 RepID=A0A4Q0MBN1_9SPHI|nr:carbonic anhydrase [Arcticibacter tournemirensis]KAA8483322.1 carbonic anhydrase [Arcticibacter tournemirensis]RXF70730.1 carbonic anhydrase [Arcticibacter tournemirensis]TQM50991.1 carbonic anhydrase [Arcticibacter tournemirensis]